ncbi:MAG TPA: trigger factor [Anaerovoracaceae bacterium]|nr:trigger factor [Anaerovoracaceae bacterium]
MEARLEKIENSEAYIEIDINAQELESGLEKAYRKVVKEVNVPGFRKGKVPREILENYFGKEILYQDALEFIIPGVYEKAVKDLEIEPIAEPEFDISNEMAGGKNFTFNAKVPLKPEVVLGEIEGLEITIPKVEIKDEDVDRRIEEMRSRYTQLVEKTDEPTHIGDTVIIDFEGFIDGEPFEGGKGEDYSLEIGSDTFIPGFEDQLVGLKKGDQKDVEVTFPETYHAEELASQDAIFKVNIKKVETKEVRELNDEFAQEVSEFETLAELREDTQKTMQEYAEYQKKELTKREIMVKAVGNCEILLPEAVINMQIDGMMKDLEQRISAQGLSLEQYLQYLNKTTEDLSQDMRPEAEQMAKSNFMLKKIIEEKGFAATDEEVGKQLEEMSGDMGIPADQLTAELPYITDNIEFSIKVDKAIQYLVDNAVITEKDMEEIETENNPEDAEEN